MRLRFCRILALPAVLLAIAFPFLLPRFAENEPRIRGINPLATPSNGWGATLESIPSQADRTIIVTGANTGLGFHSSRILAEKGARVIMACRSAKKCAAAVERIRASIDHASVRAMTLDLASLASVKSFADTLDDIDSIDALMLNAGVMACPYTLSADGIELQFAVNHVGHFYLTQLLLPKIEKAASAGKMTMIVSVSSSASFNTYEPAGVKLSLDAINDPAAYDARRAYGQSKLSNILFAKELQYRNPGTIVTAVHPGLVETELARHIYDRLPFALRSFGEALFSLFTSVGLAWSPKDAALSQVFASSVSQQLFDDKEKWKGAFVVPIARRSEPPHHAKNATLQKALWRFTEQLLASKLQS